jgi:DNA-binding MarR family transcriptional regulator
MAQRQARRETQPSKDEIESAARFDMANRLFFRLYQCANLLHKTGSRAVEAEGLTTQQWAVLGALSRERARAGMPMGELARYLMVSRQNLSGVIGRMERDGHVAIARGGHDRRERVVTITPGGSRVWLDLAQPKIRAYYETALADFSGGDLAHTLHYLLKLLGNMTRIDAAQGEESQENGLPTDGGAPDGRAARPVQAARAAEDGAQARASRRVPR